jgi:hypothetical protein
MQHNITFNIIIEDCNGHSIVLNNLNASTNINIHIANDEHGVFKTISINDKISKNEFNFKKFRLAGQSSYEKSEYEIDVDDDMRKDDDYVENVYEEKKEWFQAKRITWVNKFLDTSQKGMWKSLGKQLKKMSDEMNYRVENVDSHEYGTVNAYHSDVIFALKQKLEIDDSFMKKYRKLPN